MVVDWPAVYQMSITSQQVSSLISMLPPFKECKRLYTACLHDSWATNGKIDIRIFHKPVLAKPFEK